MGHDDKCFAGGLPQVKEKPVEFGTVMAVEAAGRFVGKNYFRVVDERAGHCGALAFAA